MYMCIFVRSLYIYIVYNLSKFSITEVDFFSTIFYTTASSQQVFSSNLLFYFLCSNSNYLLSQDGVIFIQLKLLSFYFFTIAS